jgi:hypothetical protein
MQESAAKILRDNYLRNQDVLQESLQRSERDLLTALTSLMAVLGSHLCDDAYTRNSVSSDMDTFLRSALRNVRAVMALNPTATQ